MFSALLVAAFVLTIPKCFNFIIRTVAQIALCRPMHNIGPIYYYIFIYIILFISVEIPKSGDMCIVI